MSGRRTVTAVITMLSMALTGCSLGGPTTKDEVCTSFDNLGKQLVEGNGIIGNPLFHKAGDLAGLADRYQGEPSLAADVKSLRKISKSDSTTSMELMNATGHIANLCGHPLGTNTLFGK